MNDSSDSGEMIKARPEVIASEPVTFKDEGLTTDLLAVYFLRRRDALIAELRAIDRLLGRPQTIPARVKSKQ